MDVKIGHAKHDENGGIEGRQIGDQDGSEILVEPWYDRDGRWKVYLRPLDKEAAEKAASFVEQICADDNFGYSQNDRHSGYRAIKANGNRIEGARGNFDCSSLDDAAYDYAGLPVGSGYTGNLEERFMATGKFEAHRERAYLDSAAMSERGGLYLTPGEHVAMVLSNSEAAMPDGDDPEDAPDAPISSVVPPYVEVTTHGQHGVRVRTSPLDGPKARPNAMFGERLPYLETDSVTGWHLVDIGDGATGWITWKPKYVRLVTV